MGLQQEGHEQSEEPRLDILLLYLLLSCRETDSTHKNLLLRSALRKALCDGNAESQADGGLSGSTLLGQGLRVARLTRHSATEPRPIGTARNLDRWTGSAWQRVTESRQYLAQVAGFAAEVGRTVEGEA